MNYQQDWIMRQIDSIVKFICNILGKDITTIRNESSYGEENEFKKNIQNLIESGRIDEAECIISKEMDENYSFDIEVAIWFYERINLLSDLELENSNFSRKKILEGIKGICKKSGKLDPNIIDFLIENV